MHGFYFIDRSWYDIPLKLFIIEGYDVSYNHWYSDSVYVSTTMNLLYLKYTAWLCQHGCQNKWYVEEVVFLVVVHTGIENETRKTRGILKDKEKKKKNRTTTKYVNRRSQWSQWSQSRRHNRRLEHGKPLFPTEAVSMATTRFMVDYHSIQARAMWASHSIFFNAAGEWYRGDWPKAVGVCIPLRNGLWLPFF